MSDIDDPEDLGALPNGSIIRAANGHAYEKSYQFTMVGRRWLEAGNSSPERAEDIPLPARVLYTPEHTPSGLDEFHPDTTHNPNPEVP